MEDFQKNFLPTFFLTIVFWIGFFSIVFFTSPEKPISFAGFYILLFLASFLTFSLIFANSRRGLLASLLITLFFLLKQLEIANQLNLVLLLGILIAIEVYFSASKK
ncbi:MAG: hypothetical protein ABIH88_01940 [Patescibacteria group bacterium]